MVTETNIQPLAGSVLADPAAQTPPPQQQSAKPKSTLKFAKQARERLVLLSIGLVTAATAAMLYVLFEYSFASSVLIGGGVWSALMTVHLQLQKSAEIARLKNEIQRLESLRGSAAIDGRIGAVAQELASGEADTASRGGRAPSARGAILKSGAPAGPQSNPRWEQPTRAGARPTLGTASRRTPSDGANATGAQPVVETALWPGTALSAADPMRDQWAFRPREGDEGQELAPQANDAVGTDGGSAPSANIDADLAMVQRKIKALADEVNASDIVRDRTGSMTSAAAPATPRKPSAMASPAQASALEASIGELKATAQSMRGGGGRAVPATRDMQPSPMPAADQSSLPLPQGQALPFELLIPATAERIAISQPSAGEPAPTQQHVALDNQPSLSVGASNVVASLPPQKAFGLPELPSFEFPAAQTIASMSAPASPQMPVPSDAQAAPAVATPRNPRLVAIVDALENGEMDVFLSPIVALQSHKVSHYDVTVRLKAASGGYIDNAEQELQLAGSDFLALFDTARLRRAAGLAQRLDAHNKSGSLLSAVNGPSITNAEFLETFARVFEERDRISNQLVLTFTQADLEQFSPSAWQALGDMQAFGFRFALSQIDHVAMDFASLASRGFAFLRLEANALLNGLPARDRFIEANELFGYLAGAGMTLVADTIDDEAIRARVFGFGVLFGQGRLFGGARQVKLDQLPKSASAAA